MPKTEPNITFLAKVWGIDGKRSEWRKKDRHSETSLGEVLHLTTKSIAISLVFILDVQNFRLLCRCHVCDLDVYGHGKIRSNKNEGKCIICIRTLFSSVFVLLSSSLPYYSLSSSPLAFSLCLKPWFGSTNPGEVGVGD